MLKVILILFVALITLVTLILVINYYFYSLAPYVQPFGCEYKKIGVIYESKKLEQKYDLNQIADILQLDPESKFKVVFSGRSLGVSQVLNGVKYNIGFVEYNTADGKFIEVDFHNINLEVDDARSLSRSGEVPTTPNKYIKNNIFQMIDEMPLSEAQKVELKSKVQISCSPKTKLTF